MNNKQANPAQNSTSTEIEPGISVASTESRFNPIVNKNIHQIFLLIFINVLYIIFESVNAFQIDWISAIVYGLISASTIAYIWLQYESAKYLIPIPFISLIIVGAIIKYPLIITIVFGVDCFIYFLMVIIKRNLYDGIITTISTSVTYITLVSLSLIDRGFIKLGVEFNVMVGFLILWLIVATIITILLREKLSQILVYIFSSVIMVSILPFIQPEVGKSNLLSIICFAGFFLSAVTTLILVTIKKEFRELHSLIIIIVTQCGIILFSYSFNYGFKWLPVLGNILLIDYGLHIPLAVFAIVNFLNTYYKNKRKEFILSNKKLNYILLIMFGSFLISSLSLNGWTSGYLNLINTLVVSLLFLIVTCILNRTIMAIISLLMSYLFMGLTLAFVGNLSLDMIMIILASFSGGLMIFSVINEKFLNGEPLSSTILYTSSLILLVSLMILFDFVSIWVSVGLIMVGFYLFAGGILLEKIVWRRVGLAGIVVDILMSIGFIIYLALTSEFTGLYIGIGSTIIAIAIFTCIFLFRWSERRQKDLLYGDMDEEEE